MCTYGKDVNIMQILYDEVKKRTMLGCEQMSYFTHILIFDTLKVLAH